MREQRNPKTEITTEIDKIAFFFLRTDFQYTEIEKR